jgi:outer membrane protein assembly factor BamD (BamD/ComL family)
MIAPRRRRVWIAPLVLLTAAACSTARPAPTGGAASPVASQARQAEQLLAEADDLARRGQTRAAFTAYNRLLQEHPGDPAGAPALYGLGRLQADPAGGLRNYPAAVRAFSRLLTEYPGSRWEADARVWRAVLTDLVAREDEAVRLKRQIEHLRRTDLDLERRGATKP